MRSVSAQNWITKVILGIVTLSMVGGLGLSEILRPSNPPLVQVGRKKITAQEAVQTIELLWSEVENKQEMRISLESFIQGGGAKYALDSLVQDALYAQEVQRLRLGISYPYAKEMLKHEAMFQNQDGTFSTQKFYEVMGGKNMTPSMYASFLQQETHKGMLMAPFLKVASLYPASTMGTIAQTAYAQIRHGEFVFFPYRKETPSVPSRKELKQLYATHYSLMKEPQRRSAKMIVLRAMDYMDTIQITEAEIVKALKMLEKRMDKAQLPSRDEVQKALAFEKAKKIMQREAKHIEQELDNGLTFHALSISKRGSLVQFNRLSQAELIQHHNVPPEVANHVFRLPLGEGAIAIEKVAEDTYVVAVVSTIEKEKNLIFEEALAKLGALWETREKARLAQLHANDLLEGKLRRESAPWTPLKPITLQALTKELNKQKNSNDAPISTLSACLFKLSVGSGMTVAAKDGVYVVMLRRIQLGKQESLTNKKEEAAVVSFLHRSLHHAYLQALREKFPVIENKKTWDALVQQWLHNQR